MEWNEGHGMEGWNEWKNGMEWTWNGWNGMEWNEIKDGILGDTAGDVKFAVNGSGGTKLALSRAEAMFAIHEQVTAFAWMATNPCRVRNHSTDQVRSGIERIRRGRKSGGDSQQRLDKRAGGDAAHSPFTDVQPYAGVLTRPAMIIRQL